jgi:hypothetical protein
MKVKSNDFLKKNVNMVFYMHFNKKIILIIYFYFNIFNINNFFKERTIKKIQLIIFLNNLF